MDRGAQSGRDPLDEFADLLHQCHNVIRNREKLDPAAAFDEIARAMIEELAPTRRAHPELKII